MTNAITNELLDELRAEFPDYRFTHGRTDSELAISGIYRPSRESVPVAAYWTLILTKDGWTDRFGHGVIESAVDAVELAVNFPARSSSHIRSRIDALEAQVADLQGWVSSIRARMPGAP